LHPDVVGDDALGMPRDDSERTTKRCRPFLRSATSNEAPFRRRW
jgi:hypothetical protein